MRLLIRNLINTHFDKTSTFDKWVLCFMGIFMDVPGYESMYSIDKNGCVKSLSRIVSKIGRKDYFIKERIKTPTKDAYGYLVVDLYKEGVRKKFKVHQLVAMTFLNHKPCGLKIVVDHIDNNKLNNNLSNLQLITCRENSSKDKKGFTSSYIGVSRCNRKKNKWQVQIQIKGKAVFLGRFEKEKEAATAYKNALNEIKTKEEKELINKIDRI